MASRLERFQDYTREEVHGIFDPRSVFTPQAGTWGLQGIVSIPDRLGDFVFFVTFGQKQAHHVFDEGVTTEGVLTWQSQPSQTLADRQINQLIHHDADRNSIYLFLRTNPKKPYTHLGRLKYLRHDIDRERPVYFHWQILDWDPSEADLNRIGLRLEESVEPSLASSPTTVAPGTLRREEPAPRVAAREGVPVHTGEFRGRKNPDRAAQDARNRQLGEHGERLVLAHERRELELAGRTDLAAKVRHVSQIEGDGTGYDIESFEIDGTQKFIEVKTTRGDESTEFLVSRNEVEFSAVHAKRYYLYRVYDFDPAVNSGAFYVLRGALTDEVTLLPTLFRASRSR